MKKLPIFVVCAVTAKILEHPFRYRVYVNNELFTERTWIWPRDYYLEEMLTISAPAGIYPIRFEIVDPENGRIKIRNYRITGTGRMVNHQGEIAVEITDAST